MNVKKNSWEPDWPSLISLETVDVKARANTTPTTRGYTREGKEEKAEQDKMEEDAGEEEVEKDAG